jgi:hypothetical protein
MREIGIDLVQVLLRPCICTNPGTIEALFNRISC